MYCPQCAQAVVSGQQFCAKCGFPLEDLRRLLAAGGELKQPEAGEAAPALTERQKGVRQGVKLMLLCLVLLPLHMVVEGLLPSVENTNLDDLPQFVVDALLSVIMLGGVARVLYALAFERGAAKRKKEESRPAASETPTGALRAAHAAHALPPMQSVPASDFTLRRNTAEMFEPPASVTERTTSLLDER